MIVYTSFWMVLTTNSTKFAVTCCRSLLFQLLNKLIYAHVCGEDIRQTVMLGGSTDGMSTVNQGVLGGSMQPFVHPDKKKGAVTNG